MAIVGTAYVRLRVIGDKLKGDIADATRTAVNDAGPDLRRAGNTAGEHVAEGTTETVERDTRSEMDRIGDSIGNQLGNAMGDALGRSLRRRVSEGVTNSITRIRGDVTRTQNRVTPVFDRMGKLFGQRSGSGFAGVFKNMLVSGIGLAVIAVPSILAFLGAAIGAVAATAVTALSAIGPAAAGAGVAAVAAFASIKLTSGLLGLALKTQTAQLDAFQKRTQALKDSIGVAVQAPLLNGLSAAVGTLQRALPGITAQLRLNGQAAGDVAKEFANAVTKGAMMDRIRTILQNNTTFIYGAGNGVSYLAQAFIVLLSHLGPVIDYLSQGIQDLGFWALNAILAGEASGSLDSFITRMFGSLTYFVGILSDFAHGIKNIFAAAYGASGGMLTTLHDSAAAFDSWTGDPANQDRMVRFFEKMRAISAQVLGVLRDISSAALHGLEGTSVERFTGAMNTLRGVGLQLASVFRQIQDSAGGKLQDAFNNFLDMLTQMANSGVIGTVATALSNLFWSISQILQIPGVGQLLAFGAGILVIFKTVSMLWAILGPIIRVLFILGQIVFTIGEIFVAAFGWIPLLIAAVVAALIWFFTQTEIGRAIIAAVWDAIKVAIEWAVNAIIVAFNWLVDAFKVAWAWISNIAQGIWQAISTAFNAVVSAVQTAIQTVWNVIVTVFTAIWGFIQPILSFIGGIFATVFGAIRTIVETAINIIYQIWIRVFPLLLLPLRIWWGLMILIWTAIFEAVMFVVNLLVNAVVAAWNWLYATVSTALGAVRDFIVGVWNAIVGFVVPIVSALVDEVVRRWNNLVEKIQIALNFVWGIITAVWNAIWGFIAPIVAAIVDEVVRRWNNLVDRVRAAMDWISGIIRSVWDGITGFLSGAMDRISGIVGHAWDILGNVGTAALNGIKAGVNTVIGAINTVIDGINWAINLANQLPGPDIPTIPKIPRLARGGVVSPAGGGTLAMIAEAGRPERVEPLDAQGLSARDRAIITQLAGAAGGAGGNVTIYIGTRELTELVDFVVEDREDRLADRVVTGTKVG